MFYDVIDQQVDFDGVVQDCDDSSESAMELLEPYTKPLICLPSQTRHAVFIITSHEQSCYGNRINHPHIPLKYRRGCTDRKNFWVALKSVVELHMSISSFTFMFFQETNGIYWGYTFRFKRSAS